jgi:hypothetical protein
MEPDAVSRRIAAAGVPLAVARFNAIIWGGCALLCFAAAAYLTWLVIHGQYENSQYGEPDPADVQILTPYVDLHPSPRPSMRPQGLTPSKNGLPAPPPVPPATTEARRTNDLSRLDALASAFTAFFSGANAAHLELRFPPGIAARIVVNHLVATRGKAPCTIQQGDPSNPTAVTFHEEAPKGGAGSGTVWGISLVPAEPRDVLVLFRPTPEITSWRWVLKPDVQLGRLACSVRLPTIWETFVTRRMLIGEYLPLDAGRRLQHDPSAYALSGYEPVRAIHVYFEHIAGAENIQYVGGRSWVGHIEIEAPESARTIPAGEIAEVTWHDLSREGARDAIFVIVGALIAIGAAMAVEAARPYIERYVEARGESQPQRAASHEGTTTRSAEAGLPKPLGPREGKEHSSPSESPASESPPPASAD